MSTNIRFRCVHFRRRAVSLGDKIGRQKVPAMTLMLMAVVTFAVGLLRAYAVLGIWAAALLVVTGLVQAFSTGGEYAGATTGEG